MIKHIILWKLREDMTDDEKSLRAGDVKAALEGLAGKIDGLIDIKVVIDGLTSSNADMMLDSTFSSEDALKQYQTHPAHVQVADTYVRPYTAVRLCMDFDVAE